MAAQKFYLPDRAAARVDELCPTCHNPSLRVYLLWQLDWDGLTLIGERVACTDERRWIAPLKEYAK